MSHTNIKSMSDTRKEEKCVWCGKKLEEHDSFREKSAPTPRVPCLMMKSGFVPRKETESMTNSPKEQWEEKVRDIIEHPLMEYHHTEGHVRPKACVESDIQAILSLLHSAREEERDRAIRFIKKRSNKKESL